jgi:hypothetical protein
MGTIPRWGHITEIRRDRWPDQPAAADMSAALWAGWALLPVFEAVTGALVTAGNGLGFGWLGSIGLFLCNGSNESISAASAGGRGS